MERGMNSYDWMDGKDLDRLANMGCPQLFPKSTQKDDFSLIV